MTGWEEVSALQCLKAWEPDKQIVSFSNALNDAAMCLTLMEKRVIFYCMANLNTIKGRSQNLNKFKIIVRDFAHFFNMNVDTAYRDLRTVTIGIMKKQIEFSAIDVHGKPIVVRVQWLGSCTYHEGDGWLELKFHTDTARHLTYLREQFTSYHLQQASALRSLYSWRLLEKFMQFQNDGKGWWSVSVDEFCRIMEATEKQKLDFGQIRLRIIEPAILELTEKDGWSIDYTTVKLGRKVHSLQFDFTRVAPKLSIEG